MKKILLTKENGYQIPCIAEFPAEMRKVVIVIHGYDSSKESANVENLMQILPPQGLGVIAYDQPNHGSEEAAGEELSIEACVDSLARVEEYLTERFPGTEVCYFGSSFGAYILGIYLTTRPHKGSRAFMRCAAVNFPDLDLDERAKSLRPVDLCSLFDKAKPEDLKMAFAHGELDSSVPVAAAVDFAERYGYPITVFPGEEHPICTFPESPARVAQLALELFDAAAD
ncbi:MAG: alpha/beta hydrolase [Bacillota bacterium]